MENSHPLVTVTALCYNQERFLKDTLDSIKNQSYQNIEVIIIDDASKDNSVNVIEDWIYENKVKWRIVKHDKNKGICKTLNESLELATGKYYKVIACDDILLPDALEQLTTVMETLPGNFAMIYADVLTMNENNEIFGKTPFEERGWFIDQQVLSGNLFVALAKLCFIPAPTVLLRSSVVKEFKFDETLYFEDWDMWLRISRQYLIKGIAKPVVKYRIHQQSMYQEKSAAFLNSELRTVEKHLGFDKKADEYLRDFIYHKSILNYMRNGIYQLHWLWKRFLIKKTFNNFLHVLLAVFGISYRQKEKWRNFLWISR